MAAYYQLPIQEVLSQLNSSLHGLSKESVLKLQQQHGSNILKESKRKTRLSIFLAQFKDLMILILIIAAVISSFVGEHTDALVILAIIVANAWLGYSQEYEAEQSIRMLQKMSAQYAIVLRDNVNMKIEASELVPGDIIRLQAGDIVPADGRLISVSSFKTDEASLTGESQSIEKHVNLIPEENLVPGDQLNMVFKGTIVSNGSAKAVVTAIGMNTELGKIAGMMEIYPQKTPLQKRLVVFSKQLAVIVLIICIVVFAFGLWRGEPPFEMFLTSLSLAVAALPEALPAVITIALARGAKRMVKQKALVRNLPAVETLGSVTYICTDKTGTLTSNVMTVEKVEVAGKDEDFLHHAMLLSNEARFSQDQWLGDSTETALVKYALAKGLNLSEASDRFPLLQRLPFDSQRMRMSTLHQHRDKWILFTKGAPAKIIEVLNIENKKKSEEWLHLNREWAKEGLRVLFFAYRIFDEAPQPIHANVETELEYLGMAAMIDPPRQEVIEAIRECKTAGIKTVMITGDQALTAYAIAERLQIIEDNAEVITGAELQKLSPEEFQNAVRNIVVYARVSPEQKLSIVKSLQKDAQFVAMTGDGVNDAPSLKQADIGVAMGITGTDVAKQAADMILLDDNFATIVKAVREGRRIYENIRKFIVYVLSCNLGEVLTIFLAPFFGLPLPLLPIQILWINLVTDGLPGIALVAEPAEKNIMHRPPRSPKENLFAGRLMPRILLTATLIAASCIFIQWWSIKEGYDHKLQQTAVFSVLCFVQLANALSVRLGDRFVFSGTVFANKQMWFAITLTILLQFMIIYVPFLQSIFKTGGLPWSLLVLIVIILVVFLIGIESLKTSFRRR